MIGSRGGIQGSQNPACWVVPSVQFSRHLWGQLLCLLLDTGSVGDIVQLRDPDSQSSTYAFRTRLDTMQCHGWAWGLHPAAPITTSAWAAEQGELQMPSHLKCFHWWQLRSISPVRTIPSTRTRSKADSVLQNTCDSLIGRAHHTTKAVRLKTERSQTFVDVVPSTRLHGAAGSTEVQSRTKA